MIVDHFTNYSTKYLNLKHPRLPSIYHPRGSKRLSTDPFQVPFSITWLTNIAAFIAPMDVPATISNNCFSSSSFERNSYRALKAPASYAPRAHPPCRTSALCGRGLSDSNVIAVATLFYLVVEW